jgi:enoyl-CoA hydratase
MGPEVLLRERKGLVGWLTLNRPEKGNSLSLDLLFALLKALEEWAADDGIRALVIRGAGDKAFCAGFDVRSIPTGPIPASGMTPEMKAFEHHNPVELLMNRLHDFPYPTIAMLNGLAIGAGFNLAICCDLRLAGDHVRMGIPPARLGLVYHAEGLKQVAEALGMARAREVFFTGRLYAPAEVLAMGLVHQMVPRAELEALTATLAQEISANAPLSLKGIKRILNLLAANPAWGNQEKQEAAAIVTQSFLSEDAREGQLAFLQKRKPEFKGR